jgi:hypothetical protein
VLNKDVHSVSCRTTKIVPFQVDAKALGEVDYVDVIMGSNEAFLRCSTPAAAEQLVSSALWQQAEILKGKFLNHIDPFLAYQLIRSVATQQTLLQCVKILLLVG